MLMIIGLALFLGIHLVPTAPRLRAAIAARMGEGPYKALFSLISAVGLVLIVAGYWMRPERVQIFTPFAAARAAAPVLVTLAFVLLAAANMRTHLRRVLRHPMLIGLIVWSGVHLLANGDLTGTILFGSFLAYGIVDLVSAIRRAAVKPFAATWKHDLIALVAGVGLAYLTIRVHAPLFGTGPVA